MYPKPLKAPSILLGGVAAVSLEGREPRKKYRNRSWITGTKAKIQILDGKKTKYTLTVKPSRNGKVFAEKQIGDKNPDKISFGTIHKGNTRLEFCAYKQTVKEDPNMGNPEIKDYSKPIGKFSPKGFFLFINDEFISLDIDDWRKLFRISNRIGNYFGILGRKKAKKG